jgi:hypothetical protein
VSLKKPYQKFEFFLLFLVSPRLTPPQDKQEEESNMREIIG